MIIKETTYKGTRIILGGQKRDIVNKMIDVLRYEGFTEIQMPIIQFQKTFKGKIGQENNNLMFNFKDRGKRDLCLAPEYTAVVQQLAKTTFKDQWDLKLFYVQECFRGEKPQAGRYRQFTQLGIEILNPSARYDGNYCCWLASELLEHNYEINKEVVRGLDYYKFGKGFEIRSKDGMQLCGGGEYDCGVGFAIGIDRVYDLITKE